MLRERRVMAIVVSSDKPVLQIDLGRVAPITTAVAQWRETFGDDASNGEVHAAARLRKLVVDPLESHIKHAKVILISPDGALSRIPFTALPGKKPGAYLVEELAIAVVPVPQLLPELLDRRPAEAADLPSLLVVGDVDYNADPGKHQLPADPRQVGAASRAGPFRNWNRISGTRAEMDAIKDSFAKRFSGGKIITLRHDKATEVALRDEASRHPYLHLATHGFFAPEEMKSALASAPGERFRPGDMFQHHPVTGFHPGLLSGLVLAGANRPAEIEKDDGILTALEVASLDLTNVELAVLSACDTGLGEVAGGEGLLGLQRAFQTAGARTVVASLWQVSDSATQMLMARFYENLWNKEKPMSKLEALRQAQIWMLREVPKDPKLMGKLRGVEFVDKDRAPKDGPLSPKYWASFVLSGDWR